VLNKDSPMTDEDGYTNRETPVDIDIQTNKEYGWHFRG